MEKFYPVENKKKELQVNDWVVLPHSISGLHSYLAGVLEFHDRGVISVETLAGEMFDTPIRRVKPAKVVDYLQLLNARELTRYMFRLATYFENNDPTQPRFDDVGATQELEKSLTTEKMLEVNKLISGE